MEGEMQKIAKEIKTGTVDASNIVASDGMHLYPDTTSKEEESEEKLPTRSGVILNLASMRDEARMNGYDGYVKTLNRAIELLVEVDR